MTLPRWDPGLYAGNTAHHRAHDSAVLAGLDLRPGLRVLDVGCGVGDLTERVARLVPGGDVLGVDASPEMVEQAARRTGGVLRFAVARAQDLTSVVHPGTVDVVLSTAVLHWVPADEHPAVLAGVHAVLRPGGTLRAELGGAGQIAAARAVLDEESVRYGGRTAPFFFPGPELYGALLAEAGLDTGSGWVRLLRQRRSLPDQAALLGWLRSQVLLAYLPALPDDAAREAFRSAAERRCVAELRRSDGSFDQDYVRLDLLARRPG